MMRRTGIDLDAGDVPEVLLDGERTFSGADMEAICTRANFRAAAQDADAVTPEILAEAVADFIPPTYPDAVELQTLAAVLECTSRELLPARYRDRDRGDVVERVDELKRRVR
jgi:SpoVK/Ycf46/Vps4 family AAA+-type ATPase